MELKLIATHTHTHAILKNINEKKEDSYEICAKCENVYCIHTTHTHTHTLHLHPETKRAGTFNSHIAKPIVYRLWL